MSLRIKLTLFMLVASIFPMLLYAGIAYNQIRANALQTAIDTSTALFESKMAAYEEKVKRLENTALDIISNKSLRLLFKPIRNNATFSNFTSFQRWQIVNNYSIVERCVDAHFAAQRDLLNGIGLVVNGQNYKTISIGNFSYSAAAIEDSLGKIGQPLLYMDFSGDKPLLSISLTFSDVNPGDVLGTCLLTINIDSLFGTLLPPENAPNEQLFILDENETVLFHSNDELIGAAYLDESLLIGEAGTQMRSYLTRMGGQTYIVTCQKTTTNSNWTVYYAMPYAYFEQSSQGMANMILPFAFICAMTAVVAALLFSWNVYSPIRHLTQAISRMSGRDLKVIEPQRSPSEITLLTSSFNTLVEDITGLLNKVETEAENTKKAEIIALRAQISPHFLYNTLNVIKILAAQSKTDEAQIAVTGLISLLRASIGDTRDVVPLEKEIEYVDNYIILQRYRLDLRFSYNVDIHIGAERLAVPHFILQPIVENALLHAFPEISSEENIILVEAKIENGILFIIVTDNGEGIDKTECLALNNQFSNATHVWMNKVGLHNILERARHLFGDQVTLSIANTGSGTRVTLTLPAIPYKDGREGYQQKE